MKKMIKSLASINWKLFVALLVMGLCPTIYTTIRTFFLGQLPGDWAYSIAGQLTWVNLLYEIVDEAIILPLFFFMGTSINNKKAFTNRIKTGMITSAMIYTIFSIVIILCINPLLKFMATSADILSESSIYIKIESIAHIFSVLYSFICVALVTIGKDKYVYIITGLKLLLSVILDTFLISTLPISLNLGVNGIGYSNIIVNIILVGIATILISKEGYNLFKKEDISFSWMKGFWKTSSISGLESFVRNIAYILMVSRMVNLVGEQGTYWVANNFIWGWLLLPITQLGELIKQEISKDKNSISNNTLGYFCITTIIIVIWIVTIPLYKSFMFNVLGYSDIDKLYYLVLVLLIFYIFYAFQNIFDSTFYGRGKTNYMLFESVMTNSIYYGSFFIAYSLGFWTPSLIGIALMFGFGNVFDSLVSGIAYWFFLKKEKINIFH